VAAPVGMAAPARTGPEFNVFVVLKTSLASQVLKGDANGDGTRDVNDVFYLVNTLYAGGPAPLVGCDVNLDGKTDVADLFYLINFLFANGAAPR